MNSAEVLQESKKGIQAIYKGIFNYLKTVADPLGIELTAREPFLFEAEHQVTNLGLLRFVSTNGNGTYALGYSDPNFMTVWNGVFPQKPIDPNAPTKPYEFELMKHYFAGLDPELKAHGFNIDPKSAMIQEGIQLGEWKEITVDFSYKLPITTKFKEQTADLVFEVPLFNMEYARKFAFEKYGFKTDARFMVVDDSLVSRRYSKSCLAMAGYFNIEECPDGQVALAKIMGANPGFECIVADWHMPVMSGLELLKKIRAVDKFKKLPVIMLTGEKNKEEVLSAIKEGASGYLVKPATYDGFFKSLKKVGGKT